MTQLLSIAEIAAIKKLTRQQVDYAVKKAKLPLFRKQVDFRRHDGSFIKKTVHAFRDTDLKKCSII